MYGRQQLSYLPLSQSLAKRKDDLQKSIRGSHPPVPRGTQLKTDLTMITTYLTPLGKESCYASCRRPRPITKTFKIRPKYRQRNTMLPAARALRLSGILAVMQAVVAFQPLVAAPWSRGGGGGTRVESGSMHFRSLSALHVATSQSYAVEVLVGGEENPRVLDVAAFRNGMVNPEMMVERAKSKRDAVDTTAAALDGLKIGLAIVGPVIGGFTYVETNDLTSALQNYAVLGGGIGVMLAINNYMGRGVHVPDVPEATK